jgi:Ser/Thr protein kinase RdoA (MazF antagonist)
VLSPEEVAAALADLHLALRDLDAELPRLAPCTDVDLVLDLVEHLLPAGAAGLLRAENDRLRAAVAEFPVQPLHGDAHPANLLVTPAGWRWNDFEDTWLGPLGWDLACMAMSSRFDGQAAVAAYPTRTPPEELAVCVELRKLVGVAWRYARSLRWPEYKEAADQHFEAWLAAR